MKRIILVMSAAALVAAITAFSPVSAFAQEEVCGPLVAPQPGSMGHWTKTCYSDEVITETGPAEATEAPCQLGNSPREATQEGTATEFEVTYRSTYTYYYRAGGSELANDVDPNPLPEGDPVVVDKDPVLDTFEPTGRCLPTHPGGRPA